MEGRMDGQTHRWMDRRPDRPFSRDWGSNKGSVSVIGKPNSKAES